MPRKLKPLPEPTPKTVPQLLREMAATYEERNKTYGSNYRKFGGLLKSQFPNGIPAMDEDGWNRLGVWLMVQVKMSRYAESMLRDGRGHLDSAHDAAVYAAMLEELTQ